MILGCPKLYRPGWSGVGTLCATTPSSSPEGGSSVCLVVTHLIHVSSSRTREFVCSSPCVLSCASILLEWTQLSAHNYMHPFITQNSGESRDLSMTPPPPPPPLPPSLPEYGLPPYHYLTMLYHPSPPFHSHLTMLWISLAGKHFGYSARGATHLSFHSLNGTTCTG